MSADDKRQPELARLRRLLDAYGADRRRWPRGAEPDVAALLAAEPAARAADAEARALDRVLDGAPGVEADRARALADRIVAEALTRPATASGTVIDLAARRGERTGRVLPRRQLWQAAAAMAASLLLGVVVGGTDLLGGALDGITGLVADGDTLTATLGQALQLPVEEEAL